MARSRGSRNKSDPMFDLDIPNFEAGYDSYFENINRNLEKQEKQYRIELQESATIAQRHYYEQMAATAAAEREYLRLKIQQEKERAEREYWISPEGRARIKKNNARLYYLRSHIINFLWTRPVALINKFVRKIDIEIDIKNYVSGVYWLFVLILGILTILTPPPATYPGFPWIITIPLVFVSVSLFGAIFVVIFYLIKFEVGYFIKH